MSLQEKNFLVKTVVGVLVVIAAAAVIGVIKISNEVTNTVTRIDTTVNLFISEVRREHNKYDRKFDVLEERIRKNEHHVNRPEDGN